MNMAEKPAAKPRGRRKSAAGVLDSVEIDRIVGQQVRLRRLQLGLSQGAVGEKIGLTFQQIQKYEKGTSRISVSTLLELAIVLKCPLDFFYSKAVIPDKDAVVPTLLTAWSLRCAHDLNRISDTETRQALSALFRILAKSSGNRP